MRPFKILMFLAVTTLLWGCNLGCEVEKVLSEKLATQVARVAVCKNVDAIQADVLKAMDVVKFCAVEDKFKGCKDLKKGPIANLVCPLAANALVAVAGKVIPPEWGCDPTQNVNLVSVIELACASIPF